MPRALATIRDSMGSENPRVALDAAARWVELWGKYRGLVLETGQDAGEEDDVADIPDDQLFAELKRRVR